MYDNWILDAGMSPGNGMFCFCPVELDDDGQITTVVTGLNMLSGQPPSSGVLIGVIHEDGQEAVEAFCEANREDIDRLLAEARRLKTNPSD